MKPLIYIDFRFLPKKSTHISLGTCPKVGKILSKNPCFLEDRVKTTVFFLKNGKDYCDRIKNRSYDKFLLG
ncbi:MAG: hypothetical protein HC903_29230 [Methylacidiphilales bacterium]|nr:hypothetical protein [Candidatus Methylacidiphilales bacterium]